MDTESERADSTGSSLLSVIEQLKQAEDIIKEHGDPREITGRCLPIRNMAEMICNTSTPDQLKLYKDLVENNREKQNDLERQ